MGAVVGGIDVGVGVGTEALTALVQRATTHDVQRVRPVRDAVEIARFRAGPLPGIDGVVLLWVPLWGWEVGVGRGCDGRAREGLLKVEVAVLEPWEAAQGVEAEGGGLGGAGSGGGSMGVGA